MRREREPSFSVAREVAIGLSLYAVYMLVRKAVVHEEGEKTAFENAEKVVALEERAGIHIEAQLQRPLLRYPNALHVLGLAYAIANVGLTVGWLIRLFRRRDPSYHRLRSAAVLATLLAQPLFLRFPCAPPRRLDHIVDTISDVSGVDMDHGLIARFYDPLAAMPSIHVTYAVITAAGVQERSPSAWRRAASHLYAPLVTWIVFVTGNHYVLDAIVGGTIGKLSLAITRRLYRR